MFDIMIKLIHVRYKSYIKKQEKYSYLKLLAKLEFYQS